MAPAHCSDDPYLPHGIFEASEAWELMSIMWQLAGPLHGLQAEHLQPSVNASVQAQRDSARDACQTDACEVTQSQKAVCQGLNRP